MERKSVNYVIGRQRIEGWGWHYLCIIDEKSGTFAFHKFPEEYIDPIGYNRDLLVAQVKPVMAQKLDLQEKKINIAYLATQKINIDDETQRYNNYFALSIMDDESELLQKEFYINETHYIWFTEDEIRHSSLKCLDEDVLDYVFKMVASKEKNPFDWDVFHAINHDEQVEKAVAWMENHLNKHEESFMAGMFYMGIQLLKNGYVDGGNLEYFCGAEGLLDEYYENPDILNDRGELMFTTRLLYNSWDVTRQVLKRKNPDKSEE